MISLVSIQQWIKDLVFGRKIPSRYKYITVDFKKTPVEEMPRVVEKSKTTTKIVNGERIVVLPFEDPDKLTQFVDIHKTTIYKYMLSRFESAIRHKRKSTFLFQFGNTKKYAQVYPDKYESQLNKMLDFFVGIEDYESATKCRDLIRGL
jgi:hypothetical protein